MRISDWSSDVCSSDLRMSPLTASDGGYGSATWTRPPSSFSTRPGPPPTWSADMAGDRRVSAWSTPHLMVTGARPPPISSGAGSSWPACARLVSLLRWRSEEHTSELQSLMRISYAVFCLKKKQHKHKLFVNTLQK